ncbi:MAG TPA: hypothetical protein VIF82_06385 [Burkholderiaceae bacterium]|jgi:hypothetical protein
MSLLETLSKLRAKHGDRAEIIDTYLEGDSQEGATFFRRYEDCIANLTGVLGEPIYSGSSRIFGHISLHPISKSVYERADAIAWWELGSELVVLTLASHDGGSLYHVKIEVAEISAEFRASQKMHETRVNEINSAKEILKHEADEYLARADKAFWNLLGEEIGDEKCRESNCERMRIRHSAFCRIHHFERQLRRPCPFN